MTVAEITNEEGVKIANVLGEMFVDKTERLTRAEAAEQALGHALEVMTHDRDYWRRRCEDTERERDADRERAEVYLRQWKGVRAIANEAVNYEKHSRESPMEDEKVKLLGAKFGADNRQN
jgi:hypothetical protein